MRRFISLFASILLFSTFVYATHQFPDYIIYKNDTFSISSYPLEQYFRQNGIEQPYHCGSTACWRGYTAIWEIKNDSLFLREVSPCNNCADEKVVAEDMVKKIRSNKALANWYSGKINIHEGEYYKAMNIYEDEEEIDISNGIVKQTTMISNRNRIKDDVFSKKVLLLNDTLLYYFNKKLNWEKGGTLNGIHCSDEYLITYNKKGNIRNVQLLSIFDETLNHNDSITSYNQNQQCSMKIKNALQQFSLNYLNPRSDFRIIIKLFYNDKLEIWECHYYQGRLSNNDNWGKR